MEKFKKFADLSTGKNPFLPPQYLSNNKSSIIDLILGLVRLILFMIIFPFYLISSILQISFLCSLFAEMLLISLGISKNLKGNIN